MRKYCIPHFLLSGSGFFFLCTVYQMRKDCVIDVYWKGVMTKAISAISIGDTLASSGGSANLSEVLNGIGNALKTDTDAVKAIAEDAVENEADEYDSTKTYAVGDLCIYQNTLYRCSTVISTAESWTAAHWTQTTIQDELSTLNDHIGNLGIEKIPFSNVVVTAVQGNLYRSSPQTITTNIDIRNGAIVSVQADGSICGITIYSIDSANAMKVILWSSTSGTTSASGNIIVMSK